jgi:hypothetical protein
MEASFVRCLPLNAMTTGTPARSRIDNGGRVALGGREHRHRTRHARARRRAPASMASIVDCACATSTRPSSMNALPE